MKIKYISHACIYCEAGDDRILMDPWFGTPAYFNQWHIKPQPLDEKPFKDATVILISHGHEDHLHMATLKQCTKDAVLYYPYQPFPGSREFFKEKLGFRGFVEAIGNRPYKLPGGARVTFFPNGHDCIFVIEHDGQVLVNVNDALHSRTADRIEKLCKTVRRQFPKIDYVFCGFGGASCFPNCFHQPAKDDFEIAWLRELYFARNFCLISRWLEPAFTVPFARDFQLRHESLLWINDTRIERSRMLEFYDALFADAASRTEVKALLPGQEIDEQGRIAGEFEGAPDLEFLPEKPLSRDFESVVERYRDFIEKNVPDHPLPVEALPFAVKVTHSDRAAWIVLDRGPGGPTVTLQERSPERPMVSAAIGADSVAHLLKFIWHSDVISIGYGMEFWFDDSLPITDKLVRDLEGLVTRYPKIEDSYFKTPLRILRWAVNNHEFRFILAKKLGLLKSTTPFRDASRAEWLDKEPSILAKQLGIPESLISLTPSPQSGPVSVDG